MKEKTSKHILNNISWSFAEKFLTDFVEMIITIVLARLLLPEDYGLVALVQIFITISSIFVTCGLGTALIQNKTADEDQVNTIFTINFLLGLFLYTILFIFAPMMASFRGNASLTSLIRVLGLKVPISSIYSIQHAHIQKKMEFKRFFFSSLVGTVTAGVVGIWMAYSGYGVWALVIPGLIDQILDSVILFTTTKWFPRPKLCIKKSSKMIRFGFGILVSEFMSRIYEQIKSLIIGIKYTPTDLAYHSKGIKFPQMVENSTNAVILKVLFPVLSNYQDDLKKMREVVSNCVSLSSFILCPLIIGMASCANNFIPLLLTEKWIAAIPYLQISCLGFAMSPVKSMDVRVIQALGLSKTVVKMNGFSIIVNLTILITLLITVDSPIVVIISSVLTSLINFFAYMYMSGKLIGYGIKEHLKDLFPIYLNCAIMAIVVLFLGKIQLGYFFTLCLQVLSGIIVYVLLSFILRLKQAYMVIDMIKKRLGK